MALSSDVLSDTLCGASSDILSDGVVSGISSDSRLRSGEEHFHSELAFEVRRGTLPSGGERCRPTLARSGREHCERRGEARRGEERRGEERRREEKNSEVANIKSNNPHLTGGETELFREGVGPAR